MIITVSSFKGGVAKTCTAIHLAAYFQQKATTLLADGDLNRSATSWAERGNPPFKVLDRTQMANAPDFEHLIIDTPARPSDDQLLALAETSDLLVIPTTPTTFAVEALIQTIGVLSGLPKDSYRILLTIVPPYPSKEGEKVRASLVRAGLPVFKTSVSRLAAFQKAEYLGIPVYDVADPRAQQAWADYVAVGEEILS